MLSVDQIRNRYLRFFEREGHRIMPSSALVPDNDPTTLFTSSGMQPIVPYLLGAPHPLGSRITNSQKCFRAEDAEEVGDNRHTTFFEMLGNWSLGDYFKEKQLPWFFSFLVDEVGLSADKLYVSVFSGEPSLKIPRDDDSAAIWKKLFAEAGIEAAAVDMGSLQEASLKGMQGGRIFFYDSKKNWWSRSGPPASMPAGEPGGPDSEVFYDFGTPHDPAFGKECHPNCDCGRFMEIGNSVFMEYRKEADGSFGKLPKRNVDFGGGLERIAAAANGNPDVFTIDTLARVIGTLESATGIRYAAAGRAEVQAFRVAADHIRAAVFMMADGVLPGNKERGYILRRLIRRALFKLHKIGVRELSWVGGAVSAVVADYGDFYPEVAAVAETAIEAIGEESRKFFATLETGERMFEKMHSLGASGPQTLSAKDAFLLFTTYGYPVELTKEISSERGIALAPDFEAAYAELIGAHQTLSRSGTEQKFKGGLADTSGKSLQYHTATHLLHMALRRVLGDHVSQRGSNITPERLRFDFSHGAKMTDEEKAAVEKIVNEAIKDALPVQKALLPKAEAEASGALHFFAEKYGDEVSVYFIGHSLKAAISKEFCGGPHVSNTNELEGTFRILKEEAVSSGVRRIKAVLV